MADFAKELEELEAAVQRLEGGEIGLDDALKAFEDGLERYKKCLEIIDAAEQRVQKLVQTEDGGKLVEF